MAEAVRDSRQDYWRPAKGSLYIAKATLPESLCQRCGSEFALGARFCHVCGIDRDIPTEAELKSQFGGTFDLTRIAKRSGIGLPSLVLLLLGCGCLLAAAITGRTASAETLADWQVVHSMRMEWLLAAIAGLLGGILLKKNPA